MKIHVHSCLNCTHNTKAYEKTKRLWLGHPDDGELLKMTHYHCDVRKPHPRGAIITRVDCLGNKNNCNKFDEKKIMSIVVKKSGKPFKSGKKTATVKGIIDHPHKPGGGPAYTFYDDDSCVAIEMVKFIKFDTISDIISFEMAKLAHSKGFQLFYDATMAEYNRRGYDLYGGIVDMPQRLELINNYFEAPTHELLTKWLRETHKIHINVDSVIDGDYFYSVRTIPSKDTKVFSKIYQPDEADFTTYEQALEHALNYALNLIK